MNTNNRIRVQFYPSQDLFNRLNDKANALGIPIAQLVKDLLESMDLNVYKPTGMTFGALYPKILDEVRDYVANQTHGIGVKFVLRDASVTWNTIPQTIMGPNGLRTNPLRARLGRILHDDIKAGKVQGCRAYQIGGKAVKDSDNAVYYEVL